MFGQERGEEPPKDGLSPDERRFPRVLAEIRRLEDVRRAAALFRSHPSFRAPDNMVAAIRKLVAVGDARP
jgi:hypothetical protein